MEGDKFLEPLAGDVVILDDPDYTMENGVVIPTPVRRFNLDYWVVRGGCDDYGVGDRVVLDSPIAGRKIKLDGICYRVVRRDHIVAVVTS